MRRKTTEKLIIFEEGYRGCGMKEKNAEMAQMISCREHKNRADIRTMKFTEAPIKKT